MQLLDRKQISRVNPRAAASIVSPESIGPFLNSFAFRYDWRDNYEISSTLVALGRPSLMCFDAALLSYGLLDLFPEVERKLLCLHRRAPDGEECGHVVTVYRDPNTRLFGGFARSNFEGLEHRAATFSSDTALVKSYAAAYQRAGLTPLYFGFLSLDDVSTGVDWRRSSEPVNELCERVKESYRYEFHLTRRTPA